MATVRPGGPTPAVSLRAGGRKRSFSAHRVDMVRRVFTTFGRPRPLSLAPARTYLGSGTPNGQRTTPKAQAGFRPEESSDSAAQSDLGIDRTRPTPDRPLGGLELP